LEQNALLAPERLSAYGDSKGDWELAMKVRAGRLLAS
jgi:hypothetical protein